MFVGNFYAVTGFMCALLCAALRRCNNIIYKRDDKIRSYFSFLMISFVICDLIDCLWGLMDTGAIYCGRIGFVIISYAVNFAMVFAVACWCMFLTSYFGFRESRFVMILQCIPLATALFILATQIVYGNTVFVIDEANRYTPGPCREYLFWIQYSYYLITVLKVFYFVIKNRRSHGLRYKAIVLFSSVVPVMFAVLQYYDPEGPYCSFGFMFSSVAVFDGMMVINKIRHSQKFETISKENFLALEAMSQNYIAVVMIDLEKETNIVVKSIPAIESKIDHSMPLRDRIKGVFRDWAEPRFAEQMNDFSDIDYLPEKMVNRRSISLEYCSRENGWCLASFIAAERDEERNLKKVVLAIQSTDEVKKKELEYEDALSRAYKNENAVLAELIKMQSTGVVASTDRKIIIVNDAALEMFNCKDTDPVGMEVFEFWKDAPIKTSEDIKTRFFDVEENGGSFSYQTLSYTEGKEKDMRYLKADVKRVDLMDGTKVMITCFTDITAGKLLEDKLRTLSETDALTGIANRRCGESQIKILIGEGIGGIFCLFDINGFKKINDTFGHQTGDDTLIAVAKAIKASFRADDIIMRLGGDEFAIYMRNVTTVDLARIRIARLFENIARIELPDIPKGSVTVSLGAVIVEPQNGEIKESYDDIYKRADERMYSCKSKPGSNISIEER